MRKDLMTYRFASSVSTKKYSRLNWNSIGTRNNWSNGQLQENKKNKTTLHFRNIVKKMMQKYENLIYKSRN